MDHYHSIVGPMVSCNWKPLENQCYQWFWWPKSIEKPLLAMVYGPKSIGKPLLPMVLETKNHRKTIEINGDFPSLQSSWLQLIRIVNFVTKWLNLATNTFVLIFLPHVVIAWVIIDSLLPTFLCCCVMDFVSSPCFFCCYLFVLEWGRFLLTTNHLWKYQDYLWIIAMIIYQDYDGDNDQNYRNYDCNWSSLQTWKRHPE